jgi:fructokinase
MNYKNNNLIFVGLGELLWDMLPTGKQLGGAPANFAYHAQQLGAESYIISSVGSDALGDEIYKYLKDHHLSTEYINTDPNSPTGTVDINVDDSGIPEYTIHTDVAWDKIPLEEKTQELLSRVDAICFGSLAQRSAISAQTIQSILKSCPTNCFKIYDINIRQTFYTRQLIAENLKLANGFKLNDEEFELIANMFAVSGQEEIIAYKLMYKFDLDIIALTKGSQGSVIYSGDKQSYRKSPKISVADTVGAGDAFTAGLAYAYLNRLPLTIAHDYANMLAAYVCTQKGAMPQYSTELKEELNKLKITG